VAGARLEHGRQTDVLSREPAGPTLATIRLARIRGSGFLSSGQVPGLSIYESSAKKKYILFFGKKKRSKRRPYGRGGRGRSGPGRAERQTAWCRGGGGATTAHLLSYLT